MHSFKNKYSLRQRKEEGERIRNKYPDRVPVIIEKRKDSDIQDIDKQKFLVPDDLTVGQFIHVIRKRISLPPDMSIFIFVNNTLPLISDSIIKVYQQQKDEDNFLYMIYSGESTFGEI